MAVLPKIHIALPVMNEGELLQTCLDCIVQQTLKPESIVICVNQPDNWWENPLKKDICLNNCKTLEFLIQCKNPVIKIIDRTSKGNGWKGKQTGVGWARKMAMDFISDEANENDIMISMDADTVFGRNYFYTVSELFKNSGLAGLSNPYYHNLTGKEAEDRAILRYEIYMRNYSINLLLIHSPYAFTALGSAMACKVSAFRAIGGITPKLSGEDFYFLQKLKKYGKIGITNNQKVYPAARFSDRVFFGTGPAMIKGNAGDWSSYPIYHHSLFDKIKSTYYLFPLLFKEDKETPMTHFLQQQFNSAELWSPLRKNFITNENFIRACHEKIDGLRILQYMKQEQAKNNKPDAVCLKENLKYFSSIMKRYAATATQDDFCFNDCSIPLLDEIRNYLVSVETELQGAIVFL